MKTTQDDGGPAFPYANPDYDGNWTTEKMIPGMSLRDWLAGMALQAVPHVGCGADLHTAELAAASYQIADAMLAARKESK